MLVWEDFKCVSILFFLYCFTSFQPISLCQETDEIVQEFEKYRVYIKTWQNLWSFDKTLHTLNVSDGSQEALVWHLDNQKLLLHLLVPINNSYASMSISCPHYKQDSGVDRHESNPHYEQLVSVFRFVVIFKCSLLHLKNRPPENFLCKKTEKSLQSSSMWHWHIRHTFNVTVCWVIDVLI